MPASRTRTPHAGRPLRRDAQRNRERILGAARELFAERGLEATLDDIAARAGVGVGTVYRRYPNKDALADELFEERIAELGALAEAFLSDPDGWRALIGFLERVTELYAADRALEHLVMHSDRGQERIARARQRLQGPVSALVDRAKADGRLRADFEYADIAMIHTMLCAVVRKTPEVWRRYFAMIVDGLASRP
jgi:AcrR family transcriptional regulator